ncbi:MAG: TonB-dependent receptor [Planctomycetes bacterium]|nr:TonB-dependent receptor [Planctomycetota bacterium]
MTTDEKAFSINVDSRMYGTFAEIGAGQEVARRFFHVGGASGTIAKTISAYDMAISDSLYGKADRYVTRQRLEAMLDFEYRQLVERLDAARGERTTFFAFANTIAARSYTRHEEGQGWLGIRFQARPREAPSEIIIHVRLFDRDNPREQDALGVIGVNLIFSAFRHSHEPEVLLASLVDELSRDRIEVDMIKFSGAAFQHTDNRLMSLQLVSQGLSEAALFLANGQVVQASEALYKKPVLMERGNFRPVTRVGLDMLQRSKEMMAAQPALKDQAPLVLMEMTLHNLMCENGIDHRDFLARVDILGALGQAVMISSFSSYYKVTGFLRRYTANFLGMVIGVPTLQELFEEKYYQDLEGGILEALGRLFKSPVKIFTYPTLADETGELRTAENLVVAPHLRHLYAHLLENGFIESIAPSETRDLHVLPADVLRMIQEGNPEWERYVPECAAQMIKERSYFGLQTQR